MKHFLHGLKDRLKSILEQDLATKGRTFRFRVVVATLLGLVIFLVTYSVTKNLPL